MGRFANYVMRNAKAALLLRIAGENGLANKSGEEDRDRAQKPANLEHAFLLINCVFLLRHASEALSPKVSQSTVMRAYTQEAGDICDSNNFTL